MANLTQISNATTAATALSNLILVTPNTNKGYQPQGRNSNDGSVVPQEPAILFNYEGEQTITLDSDITDHYVEDNLAIQDQIALRPETITTQGFIGELNDVVPELLLPLKIAAEKLSVIRGYTPGLSATALIAYNQATQAYQIAQLTANAAVAAWGSLGGSGGANLLDQAGFSNFSQTKQMQCFAKFYAYYKNRTLFTVQTPWAIFQNMAIKTLRAVQEADTRMVTDFEVTFKAIRFASTKTIQLSRAVTKPLTARNMQGRASSQASTAVNLGTTVPRPVTQTLGGAVGNIK